MPGYAAKAVKLPDLSDPGAPQILFEGFGGPGYPDFSIIALDGRLAAPLIVAGLYPDIAFRIIQGTITGIHHDEGPKGLDFLLLLMIWSCASCRISETVFFLPSRIQLVSSPL